MVHDGPSGGDRGYVARGLEKEATSLTGRHDVGGARPHVVDSILVWAPINMIRTWALSTRRPMRNHRA